MNQTPSDGRKVSGSQFGQLTRSSLLTTRPATVDSARS